jgi:hypothetical protein
MKKLMHTVLALILTTSMKADHRDQLSGLWYSPHLDRLIEIDHFNGKLYVDYNGRRDRDEVFHRRSKKRYTSQNGSKIRVLNASRLKWTNHRLGKNLLLVRDNHHNRRQDRFDRSDRYDDIYHNRWHCQENRESLIIRDTRRGIKAKIGHGRWIHFDNTDRRNVYTSCRGDKLTIKRNKIVWKNKRNGFKRVFRR